MRFRSKKVILLAASIASIIFASNIAIGQVTGYSGACLVVEIEGLNPQDYGEIVKSSRQTQGVSVKLSCIPADLILFSIEDLSQNPEYWMRKIKKIVVQSTELEKIHLLSNFSESDFNKKCSSYRMGIPIE